MDSRRLEVAVVQLERYGPEGVAPILGPETSLDTTRRDLPTPLSISARAATLLFGADPASLQLATLGGTVDGAFASAVQPLPFPARNVVAIMPGTDATLRNEYVALTAQNHHVGFDHSPALLTRLDTESTPLAIPA